MTGDRRGKESPHERGQEKRDMGRVKEVLKEDWQDEGRKIRKRPICALAQDPTAAVSRGLNISDSLCHSLWTSTQIFLSYVVGE